MLTLALVALGVFVVLPSMVPKVEIADDPAETVKPPAKPPEVKASTAAEQTHYRQEAQSVLAEFIAVRDRLVAQNV